MGEFRLFFFFNANFLYQNATCMFFQDRNGSYLEKEKLTHYALAIIKFVDKNGSVK